MATEAMPRPPAEVLTTQVVALMKVGARRVCD